MDCSMPGFSVHHPLPELAQTHVHRVGDAIQPSRPLLSPSLPAFSLSQHQGLFQWVSSLHQVAKYWSFSFSISPSNEYLGLFPLGLTGLISLVYIPCYSSSTKPLPDGLESVGILHVAVCLHMLEVPTSHPMPWSSQLIMLAGEKWDWLSTLGTVGCSIQTDFQHSQAAKMKSE